ncbi:acyl-CoA dehydrogenase family protein [Chitinophaga sp. Cy-1792]|uniref:acyl-CoA dehydrogenase family protein n=1 Tax=Chitinophaga sp. Cy-1792 TaxID=2608339 RepID=UPI00141E2D5A|nr:acyl-CoA dehydrogenase family protein [Chitinophaga sp. Cy-1792]NIG53894.1 DNA alkylation response protein [Chitinophaga sp. Cy-1792]
MSIPDFDFNTSLNQTPVLENYNSFTSNPLLRQLLEAWGGNLAIPHATAFGEVMGSAAMQQAGIIANKNLPVLHTHDRFGNREDTISFHPAYHQMMDISIRNGVHSTAWNTARPGGYMAHAVLSYLKQQIDEGTSCPLTMTFAVVPSLQLEPDIAKAWLPLVLSNNYDARHIPWYEKSGVTFGMAMTEPQGGSDVRSNITRAVPNGDAYIITGRKWFCSAPMSDAFLVLAQTEKGLGCFLVPRFLPDGTKNQLWFQRLKDKLGNKSNASSEVEFHGAWAQIIGEEGRGVANIMEMVRHTRLDCAIGSAATLQRALAEVIHHCHYRKTFGKRLIDQPLMQNVLADLCLESIAATTLAFRLAKGFDEAPHNETEMHLMRIATAVGKFWNTKRAVLAMGELLECLGGNGYVEESILPRLYRDVPVNAIWEGSGNIQALDILRSMQREPRSMEAVTSYFEQAGGLHPLLDNHLSQLKSLLINQQNLEFNARSIATHMALAMQAIELIHTVDPSIANAFCEHRLAGNNGQMWGTLTVNGNTVATIIEQTFRPS